MAPENPVLRYLRLRRQARVARGRWAIHARLCTTCRAAEVTGEGRCEDGRRLELALQEAQRAALRALNSDSPPPF